MEGEYVPNELIVQYKDGNTPQDIAKLTEARNLRAKAPLLGSMKLFIEDIGNRFRGVESPEKKFVRMQTVSKSVGAQSIVPFVSDDLAFKRIYMLNLDGSVDVQSAKEQYEQLPEVEFVEPNYIYSEVGI